MSVPDSFTSTTPRTREASSEVLSEFPSENSNIGKLYDPYENITGAVRSKKGAALRLPREPEFLFVEQASQKRRSWSENLCYYTGMGYGLGKTTKLKHQQKMHFLE